MLLYIQIGIIVSGFLYGELYRQKEVREDDDGDDEGLDVLSLSGNNQMFAADVRRQQ